jgi:hypothetical protein
MKTDEKFRLKYGVKIEWIKDPVPIIHVPAFGDMAAIKACEEFPDLDDAKERVRKGRY